MSLEKNLDRVLARYDELVKLMAAKVMPPSEEFARMSKECADLMPMIEAINLLLDARSEMADLAHLIAGTDGEPEMRSLAEAEFAELKERVSKLECHVSLRVLVASSGSSTSAVSAMTVPSIKPWPAVGVRIEIEGGPLSKIVWVAS